MSIKHFVEALKAHLTAHPDDGYGTYPIPDIQTDMEQGSTEAGFWTVDVIDLDKLFAEIDKFAETFERNPPPRCKHEYGAWVERRGGGWRRNCMHCSGYQGTDSVERPA